MREEGKDKKNNKLREFIKKSKILSTIFFIVKYYLIIVAFGVGLAAFNYLGFVAILIFATYKLVKNYKNNNKNSFIAGMVVSLIFIPLSFFMAGELYAYEKYGYYKSDAEYLAIKEQEKVDAMTEEQREAYYEAKKQVSEQKAEAEKLLAEKKAEEERIEEERRAEAERLATEKKAEEEKLAAEKEEYYAQFDWYDDRFGVKIDKAYTDSVGACWIEGRLIPFKKSYDYLQIEFDLLTSSGGKLGSAYDNVNGLDSGQTWHFKAVGIVGSKVDVYKIKDISGW